MFADGARGMVLGGLGGFTGSHAPMPMGRSPRGQVDALLAGVKGEGADAATAMGMKISAGSAANEQAAKARASSFAASGKAEEASVKADRAAADKAASLERGAQKKAGDATRSAALADAETAAAIKETKSRAVKVPGGITKEEAEMMLTELARRRSLASPP